VPSPSPCPLCDADARRLLLRKNGYEIAQCRACGLGYVDPMPSPEQLASLYNDDCRQGITHTIGFERYVGAQRAGHVAQARRLGDVIEKAANGNGPPTAECAGAPPRRPSVGVGSAAVGGVRWRRRPVVPRPGSAASRRSAVGGRLGEPPAPSLEHGSAATPRLLDVGCAAGFLLDELRRRGWDVHGVELSADLCRYARSEFGLDVFCGELRDAPWPPASFDVVTVIGTIEHVPDPRHVVAAACRLLVPGGLLVILTENLNNPIAGLWPAAWNGFMPPEHLYHFTPDTLGRLFAENGAAVSRILPLRSELRAAVGGVLPSKPGAGARSERGTRSSLKEQLKAALDTPGAPSSRPVALLRSAYRLADRIWLRAGVADRMIVFGRKG
jgi:2-polyprenyl-3-methyl-5-hydroxy-6-metoxy-1,4-benzoquinol methylase